MSISTIRACLLAGLLAIAPGLAVAETFKLPDRNPVATVTIPDDWETEKYNGGIEVTSEDEDLYMAFEVVTFKNVEKAIEEWGDWLVRKKVKIDKASEKQQVGKINGMDAVHFEWKATDEDGPTEIGLSIVQLSDSRALLITGWGTAEAQKENEKELAGIIRSLTKLN